MLHVTKPNVSRFGTSACLKIIVNDYEISIACDDSGGHMPNLSRTSLRVYSKDQDVTKQALEGIPEFAHRLENGGGEIQWVDGLDLQKVLQAVGELPPA